MQKYSEDPVCELNEWCQRTKTELEVEYDSTGPAHEKLWICVLTYRELISRGEGDTKQQAKKEAARQMMEHINVRMRILNV